MKQELNNKANAGNVESWVERRDQALKEYDQAITDSETFMQQVKELRGQEVEAAMIARSSEAYQKKKLATFLESGGFGGQLAKAVSQLLRSESTVKVVQDDKLIDYGAPMVFWGPLDGIMRKALDEYMEKSSVPVDSKLEALKIYFKDNERKGGAMSIVPNSSAVPVLHETVWLPDAELLKGHEGTSAWVVGSRPHRFRYGPAMYPLPGIGHFCRRVGSTGTSMLVVPVAPLVKAGLVVLADAPAMLNTEAGAKLVLEHGKTWTWLSTDCFVAWIPYGWLPIQVPNVSETDESYVWCLPVLSAAMAKLLLDEVWQPVLRLVQDHNQKLSGEAIWKRRQEAIAELVSKRQAGQPAP
jgi:hypothetical protein